MDFSFLPRVCELLVIAVTIVHKFIHVTPAHVRVIANVHRPIRTDYALELLALFARLPSIVTVIAHAIVCQAVVLVVF